MRYLQKYLTIFFLAMSISLDYTSIKSKKITYINDHNNLKEKLTEFIDQIK